MSDMKLAVEITMKNGQFVAEVVNSEKATEQLGKTGKKSFDDLAGAAARAPGPVGQLASSISQATSLVSRMAVVVYTGVAAIGAYAAAMLKGTQIAGEHERQLLRLEAQLRATGNASGKTAKDLDTQSESMAKLTLFTDEQIRDAQGRLLAFTSVTGAEFDRAMALSADLAAAMGTDLSSAVLMLGKALEDPTEGLSALGRAGVKFSEDQERVIKSLFESGRQGEALAVVLDAITSKVGGTAQKEAERFAGSSHRMAESWEDFLEALQQTGPIEAAYRSLTRLFQAGAFAFDSDEYTQLLKDITRVQAQIDHMRPSNPNRQPLEQELAQLEKRFKDFHAKASKERTDAAAKGEQQRGAAEQKASIEAFDRKTAALDALDAKYNADRVQAAAGDEARILEAQFKAGELGAKAYYERLKQLRLQAIDAQAAAVRAALGQAKGEDKGDLTSASKIYDLQQQLNGLAQQRRAVALATEKETQLALTELARDGAESRLRIEIETLRAQGRHEEANQKEREAQYEKFLRAAKARGDENAEAIAKAWLDQKAVADELSEIERQVDDLLEELDGKRVAIQVELQTGRITQPQAARRLNETEGDYRERLLAQRAQLNDPKFQGNADAERRIRAIERALADLGKQSNETVDRITRGVEGGLTDAFDQVLENVDNTEDAFAQMGDAVVGVLRRIVAEMLTMAAVNAALGLFGYQYSGGQVSKLPAPGAADGGHIARLKRYDAGGRITGPGGPTDDKVLIRASPGEFMVKEKSVRKYGLAFMEMLNAGALPMFGRTPAFAAGGPVGDVAGGPGLAGTQVNIYQQAPGAEATVQRRRGGDGREIIDVVVSQVARDIREGGDVSGAISQTFGMRRSGRAS